MKKRGKNASDEIKQEPTISTTSLTNTNANNNNNTNNNIINKKYKQEQQIIDKKGHIPLLARGPSPSSSPSSTLTFQQMKDEQLASQKLTWQTLTKFGIVSLLMMLAPILSFYGYQNYAATYYPSMTSADTVTYAAILASVSVVCVMVGYIIMAVREDV